MRTPMIIAVAALTMLAAAMTPCAAGERKAPPPRLAVDLDDGSRIIGTARAAALKMDSALLGGVKVGLRKIERIEFAGEGKRVRVQFRNGDVLSGTTDLDRFELATAMGDLSIPVEHTVTIERVRIPGLVAFYPLDGDARDSIGDNHGTVHGATLTEDRLGRPGRAYWFDADGDHIDCGAGQRLQVGGPDRSFSVSLWAKPVKLDQVQHAFGMGRRGRFHAIAIGIGENLAFSFGGNALRSTGERDDPAGWHHWVATYDGRANARRIYLDGDLVAEDVSPGDFVGRGRVYIGTSDWKDGPFHGAIDDVRLYNRALSETEVLEVYWTGKEDAE